MLFQPSNISPSTLSGIGAGTVDVTQGITVSWQVNGDTPMTDYRIIIYQNDVASTQKYSTGKITLLTPFQTHDVNGNPQFFSTQISAATLSAAGVVNGYANGYKILITQWWGSGANDYVEQTSASVFNTLNNPTLTIDPISGTSMFETITATYTQAQGDPISTVEWVFAVAGSEDEPIRKTGTVTTQILSFEADGLMNGVTYSIECNVVTASGVDISTGFIQFPVSYSVTQSLADYTMGKIKKSSGVYLAWDSMSGSADSYSIYRDDGVSYLKKVADVNQALRSIVDYSVGSGIPTKYYIFAMESGAATYVLETDSFTPVFWDYTVLLASQDTYGIYHVVYEYRFGLNVETGSVSNNNNPTLQTNFTKYPNRQPITSLYKSGQLKSYIGTVGNDNAYTDSLSLQNAIMRISTSTLHKFLKTRKGEMLKIETSGPISMKVMDASQLQPLHATIDWAEVADASNTSVVSAPTDQFFPIIITYVYSEQLRGSLISFSAENGGLPFKELKVDMQPIQSGSGNPSPNNVRPITGRTGLSVYVSPTQNVADATTYAVDWTSAAGTVYGGMLDVASGVLKARPYIASYNGETLVGPWVSSMDVYTPGGTPTTGAQVVDMGGTETAYQLTKQNVVTLLGQNYVWSNGGDLTVIYAVSKKIDIKNS